MSGSAIELLTEYLCGALSARAVPPGPVTAATPIADLDLDSVLIAELASELETALGVQFPTRMFLGHEGDCLRDVAAALASWLGSAATPPAEAS